MLLHDIIKENTGRCKESTIRGHRKNLSPRWESSPRLCPLMVGSLHLPVFSFNVESSILIILDLLKIEKFKITSGYQ